MPESPPTQDVSWLVHLRRTIKAALYSGPGRDRWQHPDRVVEALKVHDGMRVADIGAGGGYFTFRLARAVGPDGRVYALDTDGDMRSLVAARAAERGLDQVLPVDVSEDAPNLPEDVDLALIVDAFHHLPSPPDYLRAFADHLRPGGRVVVVEPVPRWFLFGHATEPSLVGAALEAAGYVIEEKHDFLPRQSFHVARHQATSA